MRKYGLHGKLKATIGNGDKLASILLKASVLAGESKGCHLYLVSRNINKSDTIWVTEVWDSREDHDNSLRNAEVRNLISQALPLLDGQPERGEELEIMGGSGIYFDPATDQHKTL